MSENPQKDSIENIVAKRLIIKAKEGGVPVEHIGAPRAQVIERIDSISSGKEPNNIVKMVDLFYDSPQIWANAETIICIDGGDYNDRMLIASALCTRSMLAHPYGSKKLCLVKSSAEMVLKFNSFDNIRFTMLEEMKSVPCMVVYDIDDNALPRENSDAKLMFEDLFQTRRLRHKPIIQTFSTPMENYRDCAGQFGRVFEECVYKLLLGSATPQDKLWRIKCHER